MGFDFSQINSEFDPSIILRNDIIRIIEKFNSECTEVEGMPTITYTNNKIKWKFNQIANAENILYFLIKHKALFNNFKSDISTNLYMSLTDISINELYITNNGDFQYIIKFILDTIPKNRVSLYMRNHQVYLNPHIEHFLQISKYDDTIFFNICYNLQWLQDYLKKINTLPIYNPFVLPIYDTNILTATMFKYYNIENTNHAYNLIPRLSDIKNWMKLYEICVINRQ